MSLRRDILYVETYSTEQKKNVCVFDDTKDVFTQVNVYVDLVVHVFTRIAGAS